jgi:glycosyltransferase involved in cell wall biosynthesis
MGKLSIIIPSREEIFLNKTIQDLLSKAKGDIEIIATLDGWKPEEVKREFWMTPKNILDDRVMYIAEPYSKGMRASINTASRYATGDYLMKIDAHCMFEEGFDIKLQEDMQDNWVVIPTRYSLDPEHWERDMTRPRRDYHYLCYPKVGKQHDNGMHGVEWLERGKERIDPKYDIDDNMSFQGSCWFMKRSWFTDFLGGMSEDPIYAGWAQEPTEIGCKTWLGGGEVKVNKKVWYAHLHKGQAYKRTYTPDERGIIAGHNYSAEYWMNNRWDKRIHDMAWLVDKFMPVPTWPTDRSLWIYPN